MEDSMRLRVVCTLLVMAGLSGCGTNQSTSNPAPDPAAVTHAYHGTASVGDFLNITVNSTARTITYTNLSNGQTGSVPYTVNANGSYTINDPTGNLLSAYEVPGYALLIQSAKSGPSQNTPALITAVESGPITMSTFANNSYNYMSFRTSFGGLEIGSVSIGPTAASNSNYWPYGNTNSANTGGAFGGGPMDFSGMTSSGTYLSGSIGGSGDGTDYIFGTASGFFIVDTPNGSIIGLPKAASSAFDPTVAGTYNGIYYEKLNANNSGSTETGTPSTGQATIVVTAAGNITVTDSNNNTFINAALTPVANASNLYGTGSDGKLTDPCYGLFTFHVVTGTYEHDVFVTFVGNSVVFSKYSVTLPWNEATGSYTYWYGVGLKQ
jgi:hypothetical protein